MTNRICVWRGSKCGLFGVGKFAYVVFVLAFFLVCMCVCVWGGGVVVVMTKGRIAYYVVGTTIYGGTYDFECYKLRYPALVYIALVSIGPKFRCALLYDHLLSS